MKNLNKNPSAWFIFILLIGYIFIEQGNFDIFIVLVLAAILTKIIEAINILNKD